MGAVNHKAQEPMFDINVKDNLITLYNRKYFDDTRNLADEYEKETGQEWILKKNYIE